MVLAYDFNDRLLVYILSSQVHVDDPLVFVLFDSRVVLVDDEYAYWSMGCSDVWHGYVWGWPLLIVNDVDEVVGYGVDIVGVVEPVDSSGSALPSIVGHVDGFLAVIHICRGHVRVVQPMVIHQCLEVISRYVVMGVVIGSDLVLVHVKYTVPVSSHDEVGGVLPHGGNASVAERNILRRPPRARGKIP